MLEANDIPRATKDYSLSLANFAIVFLAQTAEGIAYDFQPLLAQQHWICQTQEHPQPFLFKLGRALRS